MIIPSKEFERRALECRRAAQAARDPWSKETWAQLAKRWDFCAELAAGESESAQGRRAPAPERHALAKRTA